MITQYNIPIISLDKSKEFLIQQSLQGYRCFTNESGNLDGTCFSKEQAQYIGAFTVIKTISLEAANTAHKILSGIEGLVVLPIKESELEKVENH